MQAAPARTKQNRDGVYAVYRPLVESKRNKRATRARMQNNAPRRACRVVIPHVQIDESIHFRVSRGSLSSPAKSRRERNTANGRHWQWNRYPHDLCLD
ncbi:hypothetical protein PUN28_003124 [Cardiocondyla obscurior]|uniref:Uncharacterized protein n=1 Tax=Cardiocondyla obscurior TaxID=286306 RepID=A0AAW2GK45_9HYME